MDDVKAELMQAEMATVYSKGRPPGPGVPKDADGMHAILDWSRQLRLLRHGQLVALVDETGAAVLAVVMDLPVGGAPGTVRSLLRLFELTEYYLQYLPPHFATLCRYGRHQG